MRFFRLHGSSKIFVWDGENVSKAGKQDTFSPHLWIVCDPRAGVYYNTYRQAVNKNQMLIVESVNTWRKVEVYVRGEQE